MGKTEKKRRGRLNKKGSRLERETETERKKETEIQRQRENHNQYLPWFQVLLEKDPVSLA